MEDRIYSSPPPSPVINMSVEVKQEWQNELWEVARNLNLSTKETINWIVDYYFKNRP